jgi:bacterioferritin-associated ferredoxin
MLVERPPRGHRSAAFPGPRGVAAVPVRQAAIDGPAGVIENASHCRNRTLLPAMYVCVCNAVTDREIVERVRAGSRTIESIRYELGVGACCGQCGDCAVALIDETLRALGDPAPEAGTDIRRPRDLLTSAP